MKINILKEINLYKKKKGGGQGGQRKESYIPDTYLHSLEFLNFCRDSLESVKLDFYTFYFVLKTQ